MGEFATRKEKDQIDPREPVGSKFLTNILLNGGRAVKNFYVERATLII